VRQPLIEVQAPCAATRETSPLSAEQTWPLILQLAERARQGAPLMHTTSFVLHEGRFTAADPAGAEAHGRVVVDPSALSVQFDATVPASAEARSLCALFLPLVVGREAEAMIVGHLGQSLDGRVATPTGASQFITSREDVVHTHRLRAVFDAVVVGVRTVQFDNPQLTTRLATGPHPTRVILDPQGKLMGGYKVLDDGAAPTFVCTAPDRLPRAIRRGNATWLAIPRGEGGFEPAALRRALHARGLRRVFVEGGGVTVSRMLGSGMLDRLHVSVAPMILGSGAPAFALPAIDQLDEALRPRCRHFSLGPDVLFDCALAPALRAAE
jgi:diaminohydroxyphosphoribosylaminopyrimidine deaminase / 5-amino-6-(5-phosphoribosylamino)uracil reductase